MVKLDTIAMKEQKRLKNGVLAFLASEIILLLIAFLMTTTPTKTGSKSRLVEWFFQNPGYLEEVFFYWLFEHVVFGTRRLLL